MPISHSGSDLLFRLLGLQSFHLSFTILVHFRLDILFNLIKIKRKILSPLLDFLKHHILNNKKNLLFIHIHAKAIT